MVKALLHPDLKTGYQLWVDATTLLCTVLVDDGPLLLAVEGGTATLGAVLVAVSIKCPIVNSSLVHRKDGKAIVTTLDQKQRRKKPCLYSQKGYKITHGFDA